MNPGVEKLLHLMFKPEFLRTTGMRAKLLQVWLHDLDP